MDHFDIHVRSQLKEFYSEFVDLILNHQHDSSCMLDRIEYFNNEINIEHNLLN